MHGGMVHPAIDTAAGIFYGVVPFVICRAMIPPIIAKRASVS